MSWFWVFIGIIVLLQVLEAYWQYQENKALKRYADEFASLDRRDELDQEVLL